MTTDVQIAGSTLSELGTLPALAEHSYQYLLLRFLLGTVTVGRGAVHAPQGIDYSSLPPSPQGKARGVAIKDFLQSYSVGGTVQRFIKVTRADNRAFYREILSEFANFHLQSFQGRNTGAFVFLYRALERTSYSVPLLYASTQSDYVGTFKDLKALLGAEVEGDLGLFRKFLAQGRFIDQLKLQVTQKISFLSSGGFQGDYYRLTVQHFKKFASADSTTHQVEIRFADIPDLLATIRNRFFHARTGDGRQNITTIEMPDSDEYFACVNPIVMSFLATVVLHTIAAKYHV